MIFGPIFRLEMLTIGRRPRYILLRALYALGLLIALWAAAADMRHYFAINPIEAYARFAKFAFVLFACVQLGCILVLTPAMVAGTIASEHERKTIDYLLTTQLGDAEITLGKFAARLLTLGAFLLTALPIVVMMMNLGGIDPQMVYETFLYALLTLMATASLSLWISASSRFSRTAVTSTYLVVIVLCLLPVPIFALDEYFSFFRNGGGFFVECCRAIVALNPAILTVAIFENPPASITAWANPFYASIFYGGFSLVCVVAAVVSLRRTYVRTTGRGVASSGKWKKWLQPVRFSNRGPGRFPMLWKELICQRNVLRLGWVGQAASAALFIGAYVALVVAVDQTYHEEPHWYEPDDSPYSRAYEGTSLHEFSLVMGASVGSLALLLITARAAGSVSSEKEQDSWLTLLSTPLDGFSIVEAKAYAAIYSVRYWYLYLAVLWLCEVVRFPQFALVVPVLMVSNAVLAWLCAAIGLLFSIVCKNSLRAIGGALLVVLLVGVALPLLAMGAMDLMGFNFRERESASFFMFPGVLAGWEVMLVRLFTPVRELLGNDHYYLILLLIATTFYAYAGVHLSWYLMTRFDRLAGRIVGRGSVAAAIPANELELETSR